MKKFISLFVAFLIMICVLPTSASLVQAGFSNKTHVTDKSINKEISLVDWSYSRDVKHAIYQTAEKQYDAVEFSLDGTSKSYLNAVKKVDNLASLGYEDCIDAKFTLAIENIPENVRFGLSFGLKNYLSTVGTANSSFVYFTKSNGNVCLGVSSFDQMGNETQVVSNLNLPNYLNTEGLTEVFVDVSSAGGLEVNINGVKVYGNATANLKTEGFVGFLQTGGVKVYLLAVEIVSLSYDNPTTGVREQGTTTSSVDFSNNEFNVNEWFCSSIDSYYGGGMYIEDGKLVYDNASETVFSSLFAYSNFSLEVEIDDLQREAEFDGAGNIIRPISTYIGFAFGRDLPDASVQSAHNVSQFLYIDPRVEDFTTPAYATSVRFRSGGREDDPILLPDEYNFWNNEVALDRSVFLRLSVIDGNMTLELKYEGDQDYSVIYTKYLGYTPLGYVQIWTTGHGPDVQNIPAEMISSTTFKLDNISITNKDNNPLTKVVSFQTNKINIPADFPYVETWNDEDLIKSNWDGISQVKGNNGLILWLVIGSGIVIVGAVLTVVLIKKKGKAK